MRQRPQLEFLEDRKLLSNTYVVTSTADYSGTAIPNTLRWAVTQANNDHQTNDTVEIETTSPIVVKYGAISATANYLNIDGSGLQSVISGGGTSALFNVNVSTDYSVSFNNLTLENAKAASGSTGSVVTEGGTDTFLSLDQVTLQGNTGGQGVIDMNGTDPLLLGMQVNAYNNSATGGVVSMNPGGILQINGGTFDGNAGTEASLFYLPQVQSGGDVQDIQTEGNTGAPDISITSGSGFGQLEIYGVTSTFDDGFLSVAGGTNYAQGPQITVAFSTVTLSTATALVFTGTGNYSLGYDNISDNNAGGVSVTGSSTGGQMVFQALYDCFISDSTSGDGGAILAKPEPSDMVELGFSQFIEDASAGNGGAVAVEPQGSSYQAPGIFIVANTFANDVAYSGKGGSLYLPPAQGASTLETILDSNAFNGGKAGAGGYSVWGSAIATYNVGGSGTDLTQLSGSGHNNQGTDTSLVNPSLTIINTPQPGSPNAFAAGYGFVAVVGGPAAVGGDPNLYNQQYPLPTRNDQLDNSTSGSVTAGSVVVPYSSGSHPAPAVSKGGSTSTPVSVPVVSAPVVATPSVAATADATTNAATVSVTTKKGKHHHAKLVVHHAHAPAGPLSHGHLVSQAARGHGHSLARHKLTA